MMKSATSTIVVILLAASWASADPPLLNGHRQGPRSTGEFTPARWTHHNRSSLNASNESVRQSEPSYQQLAGSTRKHGNGATSESWFNAGLKKESNLEAGFFTGNEKTKGKKWGRQRDEKWFLGIRGGARAGAAADAGVSQTGKVGRVDVTSYAKGEVFIGTEIGAQAGASNTGVGVNGSAFAGARAKAKVGTNVGPVGGGVNGEAWAGAGVEAGVDAKIKNNKIHFDGGVGAAVGVGGKVGGEVTVDVGGPVKVAKQANRTGKRATTDVKKTARSASKSVKKASKKTRRTIGKLLK